MGHCRLPFLGAQASRNGHDNFYGALPTESSQPLASGGG